MANKNGDIKINLAAEESRTQGADKDNGLLKKEIDFDQTYLIVGASKSPIGVPSNINLDENSWKNLKSDIQRYIEATREDKQTMLNKIDEWQLAIQGEPTSNDWATEPFKDSCKLRSTLTGASCRIIETKLVRTILVEPYYMAEVRGDKVLEVKYRDYCNYKCKYDFDFRKVVRDAVRVAVESPAAILVPNRTREIRTDVDFELFETLDGFKAKYPDAESIGGTESQYQTKIKEVEEDIESQGYHECYYTFDNIIEKHNVDVIHPVNYIQFPWNCDVQDAVMCGHFIEKTWVDLVNLEKDGQLKEGTAKLIKQHYIDPSNSKDEDSVKIIQEIKTGIEQSSDKVDYRTKVYRIIKGLIRIDLKNNGQETDYEFWYSPDEEVLMRVAPYSSHYRKRNYIISTIKKKTNTWVGECLPEQVENAQIVCDTLIRQFVDGNSMANIPQFIANSSEKEYLKQMREDYKHRIGKIWWFKNPSAFQQMRFQRPDGNAFLSLLQWIVQDNEIKTGASRSAAGQALAEDPTAPGNKTAMLLQQSWDLISAYIDELRLAFDELMKHLYHQDRQYVKSNAIKFKVFNSGSGTYDEQSITRDELKIVDEDVKFLLRNQRVDNNEIQRIQEARADLELLCADPMFKERPESKSIMWRNYLMSSDRYSLDEIYNIVPSDETIKQEQIEIAKALQEQAMHQKNAQGLVQESQRAEQEQQDISDQILQEPEA